MLLFGMHTVEVIGYAIVQYTEENKKPEPFSYRKKVRIFLIWWTWRDSNP